MYEVMRYWDEDAKFLVQPKAAGFPAWMPASGWIGPNVTFFAADKVVSAEAYDYRVQAMDAVGNKSDWSTTISME